MHVPFVKPGYNPVKIDNVSGINNWKRYYPNMCVCINNISHWLVYSITINSKYHYRFDGTHYHVINDKGEINGYTIDERVERYAPL